MHQHGHSHSDHEGHSHGDPARKESRKALVLAMSVTSIFMVVEFIGGWWANSLALMTDAVHMLTDVAALGLSYLGFWLAGRSRTQKMSYGFHRAEILGSLVSCFLIWALSAGLIYEAIQRFLSPEEVRGEWVSVIALLGLGVNLLSMRFLHSHHQTNLNMRAAYLHVLGDLLGSIGAIIAGVVIWTTGWKQIDPIVTILFTGMVLWSSWKLVLHAVEILMESTPRGIKPDAVLGDLRALEGVEEVHDLHIWSVTSDRLALSVHVVARNPERVLAAANEVLERKYGILHTTVQMEHPDHFRSERCYDCASS